MEPGKFDLPSGRGAFASLSPGPLAWLWRARDPPRLVAVRMK